MNDRLLVGIIGGTGLGQALAAASTTQSLHLDTPFGPPSGPILRTRWEGIDLALLSRHGPAHALNPSAVPYRANIFALKSLGVTHIIASGAVGSLREQIRPRDLVIPDQLIDKTFRRPATFFDADIAVHIEFAQPFCPALRDILLAAANTVPATVHHGGTYLCMEGPQFSTGAESLLHRAWGADLIGMTCLPEAKLAREAEICYALVALPTDYDCWRPHHPTKSAHALLAEITANLAAATDNALALIRSALRRLAEQPPGPCSCHNALELAIWSDKSKIPPQTLDRLGLLLKKYLP